MRYLLILSLLSLAAWSCGGRTAADDVPATATIDERAYEISAVAGSPVQRLVRRDDLGNVLESGYLRDGKQQGTWTTYDAENAAPRKVLSYVDGILDGPYLELDEQGRLALLASYRDNLLHGPWIKYRIGRPEQTATYVDGKLDGILAEFDYRHNRLKQEVTYRMGVQHGPLRYYNDEGKVTVEYLYENGERVSGGIVE